MFIKFDNTNIYHLSITLSGLITNVFVVIGSCFVLKNNKMRVSHQKIGIPSKV